ncbi:hypothetical protein GFL96_31080 [Rhizobium leguminosarum bv. viciae]|nr:hypothetical protein [Rhizobium leguminosarum]NKL66278.1 hypothetical protein [Rhizobium leguminosarum bv. viciae]
MLELQPDGARDELGFGAIHFAYADRFFPGTSVLHTSVRYTMFVCWAYRELLQRNPGSNFSPAELASIEDRTGHKLMEAYGRQDGNGIIGGRVLRGGRSPVTRPSRIYWNALKTWGMLSLDARTNKPPNQGDVHRHWLDYSQSVKGLEVDAVAGTLAPLLDDIPEAPKGWSDGRLPLDFTLTLTERLRIRRAWTNTRGEISLMARLANLKRRAPAHLYSREIYDLCTPSEQGTLDRARQVGALVCIGRALYTAMVSDMKTKADKNASRRILDDVLSGYQKTALQLDISRLSQDMPKSEGLGKFLGLIQAWAADPGDYSQLIAPFRAREADLKDDRALLLESSASRRDLWSPGIPQPLTYRWDNVAHFLNELAA